MRLPSPPAWRRALALLWLVGCGSPPEPASRPVLFTSIEPLAGLVEAVAGDEFQVEVLVGPGASPVTYEPTSRQLTRLAGAEALFTVGVPFEWSLVPRVRSQFPRVAVVPLGPEAEAPARDGTHDHSGLDPHRWLDPVQAAEMATKIAEALGAVRPASAEAYAGRAHALRSRLEEEDRRLRESLVSRRGEILLTYHPAYGHFAARYGFEQWAIEEDGREPGPRHLAEVLAVARERRASVLFVQPQHPRRSADAVARELDLPTVVVDPLRRDLFVAWRELAAAIAPEGVPTP